MAWRCNGADWILFHRRRRMGRVVPDEQHRGMYRIALYGGRLSDFANLPRAKDSALAAATRELEFEDHEHVQTTPEMPTKRGVFSGFIVADASKRSRGTVTPPPTPPEPASL